MLLPVPCSFYSFSPSLHPSQPPIHWQYIGSDFVSPFTSSVLAEKPSVHCHFLDRCPWEQQIASCSCHQQYGGYCICEGFNAHVQWLNHNSTLIFSVTDRRLFAVPLHNALISFMCPFMCLCHWQRCVGLWQMWFAASHRWQLCKHVCMCVHVSRYLFFCLVFRPDTEKQVLRLLWSNF